MTNVSIRVIPFQSLEYDKEIHLRYQVLRKPLGLSYTAEQLAAEADLIHLGCFDGDCLLACLILAPETEGRIKMKQVAVDEQFQGKGVGAKLVMEAENVARSMGFNLMYCHARDVAKPFYLKQGYEQIGDVFEEVTIPHFEMQKLL